MRNALCVDFALQYPALMETTTIILVALGLLLIALAGAIIRFVKSARRFAGYSELREDVRGLEQYLSGESFRDGTDLVVSGNLQTRRTNVRFSQAENMPGVNVRMQVPSTFDLLIAPRNSNILEEAQQFRSGDDYLDSRWIFLSNQPTVAQMFISGDRTLTEIRKLCCSSDTLLRFEEGALELSEMIIPEKRLTYHLSAHVESMAWLARQLAQMPDASRLKMERVVPKRRTHRLVVILIVAVALFVGVASLAKYQREKVMVAATSGVGGTPQGIPADEASHIPNLTGWRLSSGADFDSALVRWMHDSDVLPSGRLEGNFVTGGAGNDHAYLLMNGEGAHRLVVVAADHVKLDETLPTVALIAKVPSTTMRGVKIEAGSPASGNSDGILLVRETNNLHSALLLSFRDDSLITAVPADYKTVPLK